MSPIKEIRLQKCPTGISGLDEITGGGIPKGRPTLVCGGAGCGKTLLSTEFIVKGAAEFNEPGVIMTFEESGPELAAHAASIGFDLEELQQQNKIKIDYVHIDQHEIQETGSYDLEGLFIRLGYAIDSIGAKRVVLDTLENIFSGLSNQNILRSELRRLYRWLKARGVTAIITAETGDGKLTRNGLEEYVSDCVILLDHRVADQVSTRRLRIIKYRGSFHGTNEYPFLIDQDGLSVLPVTSLNLDKKASSDRISSGIPALDTMLDGQGFYKGSSILVSGTAGTGKTSIASYFIDSACRSGQRCLFFVFEESPQQIIRNMRSIGLDLQQHVDSGMLVFQASRPTIYGLEMHLVAIHKLIREFKPDVVVLDPITNLITVAQLSEVKSMLTRLVDFLQNEQITVLFTALAMNTIVSEQTDEGISSLVDSWLLVRDIEANGERNRGLYIIKARGIKHSNQVREFVIKDSGLDLIDVYLGPQGVLTGSAREAQQITERTGKALQEYATDAKDREIHRRRKVLESKILSLQTEFESAEEELNKIYHQEELKKKVTQESREEMLRLRTSGNIRNVKGKKSK